MTDVAYLCHNCGSVHEVESIRQSLILDLRPAASYELSGRRGMLDPRGHFLRSRLTLGLARALWPRYSDRPRLARGHQQAQAQPAPVSDRPDPGRRATGRRHARVGNPALADSRGRQAT